MLLILAVLKHIFMQTVALQSVQMSVCLLLCVGLGLTLITTVTERLLISAGLGIQGNEGAAL